MWRSGLDGLCNYFNPTWLRFTGRTLEQEMGNGWLSGVHPDDMKRCMDEGRIRVQQVDPGELSPGEFMHRIRRAVEQDGVRVVVIDSLNGYLNAMPEERFLTIQLHELLTYLGQQGVVTLMIVAQMGLLGAGMQTPLDASYLADTVLALRYFESEGRLRRALSVIKKRSGAHEDSLREMSMARTGIAIGEPLHKYHGIFTGTPWVLKGAAGANGDGHTPG